MGKYFGTDGFRGKAGVELKATHAYEIGKFFGWYYGKRLNRKCKCVIGKDTRRSGYMLEYALVAGLTAAGADAYLMHVTTTPSVSFIARSQEFDLGIMISASHNAYYDNGIKLLNSKGEKMEEAIIDILEGYLDSDEKLEDEIEDKIGRVFDYSDGRVMYVEHLRAIPTVSFAGKRIGLDCANGASFALAEGIFKSLGAETVVINKAPDGININKNAGSTHIEGLIELVKTEKLDAGFAYDGDADRCLCVDNNGNLVDGDGILYVLGNFLKSKNELAGDVVVSTVMSNLGLYKALEKVGLKSVKTDVGDKYVYEEMSKSGYVLGGEQSGHIIISKHANTGDGILTSLMMLQVICETGKSLAELVAELKIYPQLLKNIRVADKEKAMKSEVLLAKVDEVTKELDGDGRVLVRKSGTEPLVRIMVEAATDDICKKYVDEIEKTMIEANLC